MGAMPTQSWEKLNLDFAVSSLRPRGTNGVSTFTSRKFTVENYLLYYDSVHILLPKGNNY